MHEVMAYANRFLFMMCAYVYMVIEFATRENNLCESEITRLLAKMAADKVAIRDLF